MNLTQYVESLQRELAATVQAEDEHSRDMAERLSRTLDSATRLVLLEALSAAAAEITSEMAPGSVEVRLRGRDPEFVVELEPEPKDAIEPAPAPDLNGEEPATRTTLRLPESLKARIDQAAAAEGISTNAWFVRLAARALEAPRPRPESTRTTGYGSQHYTGWVQ